MGRIAVMLLLAAAAAFPARPQAADLGTDSAPDSPQPGAQDRIDLSWGVAAVSNYVSDGQTQSGDRPAFQAYAELASGAFYSGVWLSTVDLDADRLEFDLYAGLRHAFGPVELDLGYTRYVYDASGDCCGEWIGKADLTLRDGLVANAIVDFDPEADRWSASAGLTVALGESLEFSALLHEPFATNDSDWNAGLTWAATDNLSLDLRYHGSDRHGERYVASLSYEFSTGE